LDDALKRVTGLVLRHLPGGPQAEITPDTDLRQAGLDSMGIVTLLVELEREFGMELPPDDISPETFRSIRSLHRTVVSCRVEDEASPAAENPSS
jgi:acyl carrier protein